MSDFVASAVAGDPIALERLIEEVWPKCYRLSAAVIGDRSLAQDAAQESCAIIYSKIHTLRRIEGFDAWLHRVVMREAGRVRRRLSPHAELYSEASFRMDESVSLDVWSALAQLTPEQRDVVVLFYFKDFKSEEVASILGVPHATVRTRLMRSRERLRGILGNYIEEPRVLQGEVKHYAV